MKLLPRSFFGRNVLLLMGLFAFGLGCGALALREWAQKPRITEIAELVARHIRLAQLNLELVPEQHRASMRPWLSSQSGVQVLPLAAAGPPAESHLGAAAQQFADDLRWRLHEVQDIRWISADRGTVWIRMQVGKDQYWFIEKGVYLEASVSRTSVGIFALVALLSFVGAVRIQRRINPPLARLVQAATTLGSNKRMAPLDETGPQEFALVSRAFNQMTASLAKADAERIILLAGVSHDLRTPISKMRLAIEMLGEGSDAELVQSMLRSVTEMQAVTEQFLYYARDEGKQEFDEAELYDLVMESVTSRRGGARSIVLHSGSRCSVVVHRESIRRALDNLIDNALRYSDAEVELRVQCEGDFARVSVLDRGPGIPPEEVATLKMPFARGSAAVGKAGTGLGLAIVERIVTSHGGRFDLLPREGGGTEARLELKILSHDIAPDVSATPVRECARRSHVQ